MKENITNVIVRFKYIYVYLAFLNAGYIYAQESDSLFIPTYTLKDYVPIGISFNLDRTMVDNQPNIGGWNLMHRRTFRHGFGINANIWSNESFNVRAGARVRYFNFVYKNRYPASIFAPPLLYDFATALEVDNGDFEYKFNLSLDYIFKSTPKVDYFFGLGLEATEWPKDRMEPTLFEIGTTTSEIQFFTANQNWYVGSNLDVGINIKTYRLLYRLMLTYHHNFSPPTETIILTNTSTIGAFETSTARKKLTGNYLGFGVTLHPSKKIFSKKPAAYSLAEKQKKEASKEKSVHELSYTKLGLSYGVNFHQVRRNRVSDSFNSSISGSRTTSIGLNWHYLNRKNYTLSWGLEYHRVDSQIKFDLNNTVTGTENTYTINQNLSPLHGFGIAHYFDYIRPLNNQLSLNAGLGLKIRKIDNTNQFYNYNFTDVVASLEYGKNTGFDALISPSIGLDWNTSNALLRFKIYADLNAEPSRRTEFIQRAANVQREFWSNETFNEVSFGLKLHIYPKRGLFKKK